MEAYYSMVNSWQMYLVCGVILVFLAAMCCVLILKSYRLGVLIGMEKAVLRMVVISSATFTVLPAISILIGMFALSGTLGVPMAWLRLSVIGALQYELQVTDIVLQALDYHGMTDIAAITPSDFATIALVMAVGIIGGLICCMFFLSAYLDKIGGKKTSDPAEAQPVRKKNFASYATICMFVGLCSTYFGAYIGDATVNKNYIPILIACISGISMLAFERLSKIKRLWWLEHFSLAASMIIGMTCAVILN